MEYCRNTIQKVVPMGRGGKDEFIPVTWPIFLVFRRRRGEGGRVGKNNLSQGDNIKTILYYLIRIQLYLSRSNRIRFFISYIFWHFNLWCVSWGNCKISLKNTSEVPEKGWLGYSQLWFDNSLVHSFSLTQINASLWMFYISESYSNV